MPKHADRDRVIVALLVAGWPVADVAAVARLSPRQVHRIGGVAPGAARPDPLTATELRSIRRDFEGSRAARERPATAAALEWLASQRTDRRRNGRPVVAWPVPEAVG